MGIEWVGGWFDFGFLADASSCYPQSRALRKNGLFWGYELLFGRSGGAPLGSQSVDMESLVRDGHVMGGWVV